MEESEKLMLKIQKAQSKLRQIEREALKLNASSEYYKKKIRKLSSQRTITLNYRLL